jgi:hypothetical protein
MTHPSRSNRKDLWHDHINSARPAYPPVDLPGAQRAWVEVPVVFGFVVAIGIRFLWAGPAATL